MFTVLWERVQFDMQLRLKRWRCSANDILMPETLHLSLRDTHQEDENPSAAHVNSVDFVNFKQGFKKKKSFPGHHNSPSHFPFTQSPGHVAAPPILLLSLHQTAALMKKAFVPTSLLSAAIRTHPVPMHKTHTEWSRLQTRILKRDKINCIKN